MKNTKQKIFSRILLLIYIILAIYFMLFSEAMGRTIHSDEYRYNLVLFKEIKRFIYNIETIGIVYVIINVVGNIVCFMPLGIILPMTSNKFKRLYKVLLLTFFFSLCLESLQLVFKIGSFDVDDLFLNTLGALIGYIVFYIVSKKKGKKNAKKKN